MGAEDYKDYKIEFSIKQNKQKNIILLPYKENYKIIAEAIKKICLLFDKGTTLGYLNKKEDEINEDCNALVVCRYDELPEIIRPNIYFWADPGELLITHLLDPEKANPFSAEIAKNIYKILMSLVNHKVKSKNVSK